MLDGPIAAGSQRLLLFFMDFCFACCVRVLLIYYFYCLDNEGKRNIFGEQQKDKYIYMYMVCSLHLTLIFSSPLAVETFYYLLFLILIGCHCATGSIFGRSDSAIFEREF